MFPYTHTHVSLPSKLNITLNYLELAKGRKTECDNQSIHPGTLDRSPVQGVKTKIKVVWFSLEYFPTVSVMSYEDSKKSLDIGRASWSIGSHGWRYYVVALAICPILFESNCQETPQRIILRFVKTFSRT